MAWDLASQQQHTILTNLTSNVTKVPLPSTMVTYLCSECNLLPTHHLCTIWKMTYIYTECCNKRGITTLGDMQCKDCHQKRSARLNDTVEEKEAVQPISPTSIQVDTNVFDNNTFTLPQTVFDSVVPTVQTLDPSLIATRPANHVRDVTQKPQRLHKKMKRNAEVQVCLKIIHPLPLIRTKYPNTFNQVKISCIVEDLKELQEKDIGGGEKWTLYLLIQFKDRKKAPERLHVLRVNTGNSKMLKPGLPNQIFFKQSVRTKGKGYRSQPFLLLLSMPMWRVMSK